MVCIFLSRLFPHNSAMIESLPIDGLLPTGLTRSCRTQLIEQLPLFRPGQVPQPIKQHSFVGLSGRAERV